MRSAVREVFTQSVTQALPLAARQTLWLLHTGGLPIGPRTGGDGFCPIVNAMRATGLQMGQVLETHEQIALRSPTARLVWRHVAAAASISLPNQTWAQAAAIEGSPDDATCRALPFLLGVRVPGLFLLGC